MEFDTSQTATTTTTTTTTTTIRATAKPSNNNKKKLYVITRKFYVYIDFLTQGIKIKLKNALSRNYKLARNGMIDYLRRIANPYKKSMRR